MKGVISGDSPGDSKCVSGHPGAEQLGLFCFSHVAEPEKDTWLPDWPALAFSSRETCFGYSDVTYWHVEAVGMEK